MQAEEVVVDETTPQEGTVPELELGPEGSVEEEEGAINLPSDELEFTMPEKFEGKTAEEIAKSYIELEKFKGKDTPAEETPPQEAEVASQDNKFVKEYLESGELSEESYKELAEQGLDKAEVDDRLEYEKYKQKKNVDELVKDIGGIDNFTKMDEWAKTNIEADKLTEYSEELAKATTYGKKAILKDLYGQYQASLGGEETPPTGDVVHTNEPQTVVGRGYESQHELQADMSDPRYGRDRSYTKAVEEKLAKSKNF